MTSTTPNLDTNHYTQHELVGENTDMVRTVFGITRKDDDFELDLRIVNLSGRPIAGLDAYSGFISFDEIVHLRDFLSHYIEENND